MMKRILFFCWLLMTGITFAGPDAILTGYWGFNEGEGTTAVDSSDFHNNGEITGAKWVKGRKGTGLYFDGITGVVRMKNPVSTTKGFTAMAWCKLVGDFTGGGTVVAAGWHRQGRHWLCLTRKAIDYHNSFGTQAYGTQTFHDILMPLNRWIHIAVVDDYKTGLLSYYIDGKPAGSRKRPGETVPLSGAILTIGRTWCNTFPFKGTIDEVKIYDGILTAEQIYGEMKK